VCNLNHYILKEYFSNPELEISDFDNVWQQQLDKKLIDFKPDLVGVTCMFTMTHRSFVDTCSFISTKNIPIVIGGVHVSNDIKRLSDSMQGIVDMVLYREADIAFPNLIQVINKKLEPENLAQLWLLDNKNYIKYDNLLTPETEDLDTIPSYHLLDITEYTKYGIIGAFYCFKPANTRFATVLNNRGCRAHCSFCSVRNFNGKNVRHRSVTSVVDEIEHLYQDYGVKHIMWLDDDLLMNQKRSVSLFETLAKRNMDLTWDATNGVIASSCSDEVMSAAADSGCIAINIGVESGNADILKMVKKPTSIKHYLQAAEVLRHYPQIHTSVFLMIGFPNETMSMITDTINLAKEMDMDWYRISQLYPLPNTPLYDSMVAQGMISPIGNKDTRFNGGAFGKQTDLEQGLVMTNNNFKDAFASIQDEQVPTPEQLTDIWFYMNYHLNFLRIFSEQREIKLQQLQSHLSILADVISPENGFALYFLGYLQYKKYGSIDQSIIKRLETRLETSDYWADRFTAFRLSTTDLTNMTFDNQEEIMVGKL